MYSKYSKLNNILFIEFIKIRAWLEKFCDVYFDLDFSSHISSSLHTLLSPW